jgi:hypothetical protein
LKSRREHSNSHSHAAAGEVVAMGVE